MVPRLVTMGELFVLEFCVYFRVMNDELIGYLRYYTASGRDLCKIYLSVKNFFLQGLHTFYFKTNWENLHVNPFPSVNQLFFRYLHV